MKERLPSALSGLHYAAVTDVGLRRANNQDSYAVVIARHPDLWTARGHVFLVADGMGAHAAGELASRMAADLIPHSYLQHKEYSPVDALHVAVTEANEKIHTRGQANPEFQGMGTTCTVLVVLPGACFGGHVGDSRLYRWRDGKIEQLTFDHSLVWELKAAGHGHSDHISGFVPKNIITRSLGPNEGVQVDLPGPWVWKKGDRLLLCSDGLSGQLEDAEMGTLVGLLPPEEAAQTLTAIANLRGGPDNITTIVIHFPEDPELADPGSVAIAPRSGLKWNQVHIGVWLGMGVLALAAMVLAEIRNWLFAGASGLAALATFGWALVQASNSQSVAKLPGSDPPANSTLPLNGTLAGNRHAAGAEDALVFGTATQIPLQQLSETLRKLCAEAYAGAEWMPAFPRQATEQALAQAQAHMASNRHEEACIVLSAALRDIMHKLRGPEM